MSTALRTCALVLVASCGAFPQPARNQDAGNGDGSSDAGPLTIVSVSPADSSSGNQASTTKVIATFSAAIDCSTVSNASLQVREGSMTVAGQIVCDGTMLSFEPATTLPTDTTLQASIDPSIAQTGGGTLGVVHAWSFAMAPWTRQHGTSSSDFAYGVAVDAAGNIYVSGRTDGGLEGNPNAGLSDAFVSKYAPTGARLWTRQIGSTAQEEEPRLAVDASGNIYVAGWTSGDLDGSNGGGQDLFLVKYDASGTRQWTRQLTSPSGDQTFGVATDGAGNVYVVGATTGDFDGNTTGGTQDLFLVKYNSSGTKQWSRQLGGASFDQALSVATDPAGNVYVAGGTSGDFDGNTSAGSYDLILVKYNSSGAKQWSRQLGSSSDDGASSVTIDSVGNIYVIGGTGGGFDGNTSAGGLDVIVARFDSTGARHWSRQLGTSAADVAGSVTTDQAGNVYVAGSTLGGLDGNTNAGDYDLFVAKYDASGMKQWTRQLGTTARDDAYDVATGPDGSLYVVGDTRGALDGNTSAGGYDSLAVRYEPDGRKR